MKYIDSICRENKIEYLIMGGTALGAMRHSGFIPWDDDLDIFMTPTNYEKFKIVFLNKNNNEFILQEWKVIDEYLEYSKVRMNGTTFIEEAFRDNSDMHQGIYVDIMILHKCSNNLLSQKLTYFASKFVTLVGLSKRNWKPKTNTQKIILSIVKIISFKYLVRKCYRFIYKYDDFDNNYVFCYFITKAKFKQGIFTREMIYPPVDIKFEDTILFGPNKINEYLESRYGDYMTLPSEAEQKFSVHAMIYDVDNDYKKYINNGDHINGENNEKI